MAGITTDRAERKGLPLYSGVLKYFPDALLALAEVSRIGNDQHNPGEPLHWARGKSDDHLDSAARHMLEAGTFDVDGSRHLAKAAWRLLAELQLEIERAREKSSKEYGARTVTARKLTPEEAEQLLDTHKFPKMG